MDYSLKRKKLLFKSTNRSLREVDILLGHFAQENLFNLSEEEIDQYEKIVELDDYLLYKYLSQAILVPQTMPLLNDIIAFNKATMINHL